MTRRVRLLIADHAPMRHGVRMALGNTALICAEAGTVEHAIRAAKREQPEACLIGRDLVGEGFSAVRGITRAARGCAVIVLAPAGDADDLLDAVRAGAIGYVPGGLDAHRLRRIVAAAAAKEAVVPRGMVRELLMELQSHNGANALTGREAQVLGMVRRGHSTAAIAARLEIAPVTVRRHISELVQKLGVEDRAALVDGHRSSHPEN